jgi:hypothetical protein
VTLSRDSVFCAVEGAWSSASSTLWRLDNPAAGQCSVTALLLQELLGGRILKTRVGSAWHYYNDLGDGRLDLTASQFAAPIPYDDVETDRTDAMSDTSPAQLAALRHATLAELGR